MKCLLAKVIYLKINRERVQLFAFYIRKRFNVGKNIQQIFYSCAKMDTWEEGLNNFSISDIRIENEI